jgi:hypothetical protein
MKDINYDEIKPDLNLDLMIDKYGFDNGEKVIEYFKNIMFKNSYASFCSPVLVGSPSKSLKAKQKPLGR